MLQKSYGSRRANGMIFATVAQAAAAMPRFAIVDGQDGGNGVRKRLP